MKEKGIKILFSIFLFASILMPFSVSADTISQSDVQGVERVLVNSTYLDQTVTDSGNTYKYYSFDYEVTVLLKDYYLGWIQGTFQTSYKTFDNANWQVQNSSCTTVSKSYYVNDNKFKSSFTITAWILVNQQGNVDPAGSYTTSFTLTNSNVTSYQDINSIDTIINILNDIENNTDLEVNYLNEITKFRQYSFPFESFMFIYPMMLNNYTVKDLTTYYSYQYPIFALTQNNKFCSVYASTTSKYRLIFFINKNVYNESALSTYITPSDGVFSQYRMINRLGRYEIDMYYLIEVAWSSFTSSGWKQILVNSNIDVIPIFFGDYSYNKFSTDFALIYGLSNQLLDDLHIIASGTQQSQQAGSDLDDTTSDMQSDFNSYYSIENSANSDFNSALNGINFNDQIAGNQSFLDSASFVKTVFSSMMQIPILNTFVIILCIVLMARIFL